MGTEQRQPLGMPRRRLVVLIVALVLGILVVVLALIAVIAFSVFRLLDRTDAHVCGLAIVQRSPIAFDLVGTPIVQHGITSGRTTASNGDTYQRLTFWVHGPKGDAYVMSEGDESPLGSHLTVRIGSNGRGSTIYSGPLDCPELHQR